jgi:ABC-2 type transport system ATP-binding protein
VREQEISVPLTITGLSKTYSNGVQALKNLNLTIGNNMFGLLGPNGAGKSTLMRTIATLQEPDSGEIWLDNINVVKQKDSVRQLLGYLPQEFGVYPKISALDMLSHLAVMKGVTNASERKAMVEALLNQTNLWDARKKALSTYSGGMKQRFGIAQALLANPKLIIVDEPTAGLDPAERHRFLNLLSSIGRDVIVILSTHIVEDVRELCNRMAIISNGECRMKANWLRSRDKCRSSRCSCLVERMKSGFTRKLIPAAGFGRSMPTSKTSISSTWNATRRANRLTRAQREEAGDVPGFLSVRVEVTN